MFIAVTKVIQYIFVELKSRIARLINTSTFQNRKNFGLWNLRVPVFISPFQKTLIILTSLHHNSEITQLCGTVINIQTVKVIFHDACDCRSGIHAIGFINLHKHIEHICQNMTASGTRVDTLNILWFQRFVLFPDGIQLRLNLRFLFCFFQIIFPLPFQLIIRMTFHPQTTKAVFYHVTNNPVRRKQLGCSRDIFFCDFDILFQSRKDVILLLTVIVLIEPANNLNCILPIILRNQRNHLLHNAAFPK